MEWYQNLQISGRVATSWATAAPQVKKHCLSHASVQYEATTDSNQAELTCTLTRELKMSKDNRGFLGIRKQDLNLIWRVDGQISCTNIFLTSSKGKHLKIDPLLSNLGTEIVKIVAN